MTLNTETLQMLKNALTMEEKGKRFYEKAVRECPDKLGREIFKFLRDEEVKHYEKIKEIYSGLEAGQKWNEEWLHFPEPRKNIKKIFRELARKYATEIKAGVSEREALDVGIEFESAAIKYYEKHLEQTETSLERKFIERLIGEEREHRRILEDLKYYYDDPHGWLMEKGRTGLDGA